jgi:thiamine pyrophosphokinase
MQAIILADGDVAPRDRLDDAWPGWARADAFVVAADGGARHAARLGLKIDRWVGDGDSIGPDGLAALEAAGVPVDRSSPDKDQSDTELAVMAAVMHGADEIVILGAFGGPRLDHALANLSLLTSPGLDRIDLRIVAADVRVRLIRVPAAGGSVRVELEGRAGDLVTLLPVGGDAGGVRTEGLRFPLHGETLVLGRTRGLSNVRTAPVASVELRTGRLLVIESPATLLE